MIKKIKLSMSRLTVVSAVVALALAGIAVADQSVYADGNGSPVACSTNKNVNPDAENVRSEGGDPDEVTVDVGAGNVADGVCIKSGENMFNGNQHSDVLANGTYEDDCYEVSGVGTQSVTVKRLRDANDCQGISHIDVLFSKAPTNGNGGNGGMGGGQVTPRSQPSQTSEPEAEAPAKPAQPTGGVGVQAVPQGGIAAGDGGAKVTSAASVAGLASSIVTLGAGLALRRT